MDESKSSLGLEPNIAGLLCYLFGWVTGLIFLLVEKKNRFVRFHAIQSIIVFGGISIFYIIISIVQGLLFAVLGGLAGYGIGTVIIGLFGLLSTLISILSLILWVFLMYKAYQNETYKLPIVGNMAEKQLK